VKYLGVTIDRKLCWKEHVLNVLRKANANLIALKAARKFLNESARISLFNALVISHLRYSNVVWQPMLTQSLSNSLTKFMKKGIRVVFFKKTMTHSEPLFKKSNILTFPDMLTYHQHSFLSRLVKNQSPSHLAKLVSVTSSQTRSSGSLKCIVYGSPLHNAVISFNLLGITNNKDLKNFLLSKYYHECQVRNCQICKNE
jgi:hypothetical protein